MRRRVLLFALILGLGLLAGGGPSPAVMAQNEHAGAPSRLPGLLAPAEVIRDTSGIAHIRAGNDHDLAFLQGYTHAEDRFFQMDYYRHAAAGTLAELFGPAALAQDVQLRTLGLRRAAERVGPVLSPRVLAMLEAYAAGVNAYLGSHPLPPEHQALGISGVDAWQPIESLMVLKLISFQMNFSTSDVDATVAYMSYRQAGAALGFDGDSLFFEDLFRAAPFDTAATILDGSQSSEGFTTRHATRPFAPKEALDPAAVGLAKRYLDAIKGMDLFRPVDKSNSGGGSNAWAVSGRFTASGAPLLASDPHLKPDFPSIWHPIHLTAGEIDVIGNTFVGVPLVVTGHNRDIAWAPTSTVADVSDWYREAVVPDASSPSGLSTVHNGALEHVIPYPETYRARIGGKLVAIPPGNGIPAATLVVPRRNNGPIVQIDMAHGTAISMQWTGFGPSRELDAILTWAEARTPADFERGIRLFTTTQNFTYVDRKGNIGYYMAGELPLREDLQAGAVVGLPPNLLRDGQGGNEWLPATAPEPEQALPFAILPFDEMPHVVNPPAGWVVNSNNDPLGLTFDNDPFGTMRPDGGIFYISSQFVPGMRAARIGELLREKIAAGKLTMEDMRQIQADTLLRDARYFVPFITQALDSAKLGGAAPALAALAADPAVVEAVERLRAWDFRATSGLGEGYDAFDPVGQFRLRTSAEVASSVATTIYSMWRSQFLQAVFDAKLAPYGLPVPDNRSSLPALRNLLESFPVNHGVGASGIDFFAAPDMPNATDRRDFYILRAVRSALTQLAGDSFATAFSHSANQDDYRWGKLNRLVLNHPMGSIFNVPPAVGFFPSPIPGLPGIPVDGAFDSVDPSTGASLRVSDSNGFVIRLFASQRSIAEALADGVTGWSSLPGGASGVPGSASYLNLLEQYLVNGLYEQPFRMSELQAAIATVQKYEP